MVVASPTTSPTKSSRGGQDSTVSALRYRRSHIRRSGFSGESPSAVGVSTSRLSTSAIGMGKPRASLTQASNVVIFSRIILAVKAQNETVIPTLSTLSGRNLVKTADSFSKQA